MGEAVHIAYIHKYINSTTEQEKKMVTKKLMDANFNVDLEFYDDFLEALTTEINQKLAMLPGADLITFSGYIKIVKDVINSDFHERYRRSRGLSAGETTKESIFTPRKWNHEFKKTICKKQKKSDN